LAGISPGYYTRLEQGLSAGASEAVLGAIARVLRLDADERAHLLSLAHPQSTAPPASERLRPSIRVMIESLGGTPALVLGRLTDVLAWNPSAHALLAGHLGFEERPNWAKLFFLDPRVRELFVDWQGKAQDTVADLRLIAGRYPEDPRLTGLIGELTRKSPEFAELWSAHPVRGCAFHARRYRHRLVGELTLTDELMALPDDEGQRVVVFTAEPGSASAVALARLSKKAPGQPQMQPRDSEAAVVAVQ
jgi:transcriptional regulator with XRE-family HTH domain